jgi:hypothetical protein
LIHRWHALENALRRCRGRLRLGGREQKRLCLGHPGWTWSTQQRQRAARTPRGRGGLVSQAAKQLRAVQCARRDGSHPAQPSPACQPASPARRALAPHLPKEPVPAYGFFGHRADAEPDLPKPPPPGGPRAWPRYCCRSTCPGVMWLGATGVDRTPPPLGPSTGSSSQSESVLRDSSLSESATVAAPRPSPAAASLLLPSESEPAQTQGRSPHTHTTGELCSCVEAALPPPAAGRRRPRG